MEKKELEINKLVKQVFDREQKNCIIKGVLVTDKTVEFFLEPKTIISPNIKPIIKPN